MENLATFLYSVRQNKTYADEELRFSGFVLKNMHLTNSQNFQDLWAWYEYEKVRYASLGNSGGNPIFPKIYVEVGATNGIDGSNTLLLNRMGWRGLLIEPNPLAYVNLIKNRGWGENYFSHSAIGKNLGKAKFTITKEQDLSCLSSFTQADEHAEKRKDGIEIDVEVKPLHKVYSETQLPSGMISYISLDTEGSELEIVEDFFEKPIRAIQVHCWSIEHNFVQDKRDKIHKIMIDNGYERVFEKISRWDDFYRLTGDSLRQLGVPEHSYDYGPTTSLHYGEPYDGRK